MRYLIFNLLVFSVLNAAPDVNSPQPKAKDAGFFCYWMENASGRFEWVPAEAGGLYRGQGYDRCYALDSCNGGLGQSSGGCYKWARSASAPRVLWAK